MNLGGSKINTPKKKDLIASTGLVLSFAGVTCMGVVKGLIGSNVRILSTVIVIVSVVLMLKGINFGYIVVPTADAGLIFLYSIMSLVMCLFSHYSWMANGYGFVFQAAAFVQLVLLWNYDTSQDMDCYVEVGFWFCGIACTLMLLLLLSTGSLFINSFISKSGEELFNRSTVGAVSFVSFAMSLAYIPKTAFKRQIRLIFLVISIVVILASSRRGVYIASIACAFLHLRNSKGERSEYIDMERALKKLVVGGIGVIAFATIYSKSPDMQEFLDHSLDSLVNGLMTFLGMGGTDMAASMRVASSSSVLNNYLYNSNVKQIIFGRGYMTTWVDMPFIQAFWDFGALGGITFAVCGFLIPVRYLVKKAETQGCRAAQYLALKTMADSVASGYPYGCFFNIVLMIVMFKAEEEAKALTMRHQVRGRGGYEGRFY